MIKTIASQSLDKSKLERPTRRSKRSRDSSNQVLVSKINRALETRSEKIETDAKIPKIDDQAVKERLIQAGVYLDDDNEILIDLIQGLIIDIYTIVIIILQVLSFFFVETNRGAPSHPPQTRYLPKSFFRA